MARMLTAVALDKATSADFDVATGNKRAFGVLIAFESVSGGKATRVEVRDTAGGDVGTVIAIASLPEFKATDGCPGPATIYIPVGHGEGIDTVTGFRLVIAVGTGTTSVQVSAVVYYQNR